MVAPEAFGRTAGLLVWPTQQISEIIPPDSPSVASRELQRRSSGIWHAPEIDFPIISHIGHGKMLTFSRPGVGVQNPIFACLSRRTLAEHLGAVLDVT